MPAAAANRSICRCGVELTPGRAKADLAWVLLGARNEVRQRRVRRLRVHHQDERKLDQRRNRHERRRIEAELRIDVLADRERAGRRDQERVAVGLGFEHRLGPEVRRGARPVLDDHRLAPARRELLADDARHRVEHVAGRHRHHELHGAAGEVGLGEGGRGHQRYQRRADKGQTGRNSNELVHRKSSPAATFRPWRPFDAALCNVRAPLSWGHCLRGAMMQRRPLTHPLKPAICDPPAFRRQRQ